jgi:hypothetical protein
LLCPEKMFWWLPTPSHRSPPTTRQHFVGEIFACSDKLYSAPPPPPNKTRPLRPCLWLLILYCRRSPEVIENLVYWNHF